MSNSRPLQIEFLPGVERYFKTLKKDKPLLNKYRNVIRDLQLDPTLGTAKRGDLAGVFSIDIRHNKVNYELAYYVEEQKDGKHLLIILAGSRENFYKTLKSGKLQKTIYLQQSTSLRKMI